MEPKKRFFEISLLNVFLCMLVIFIHVSSAPISNLDKTSWQYLIVYIPWRLSAFAVYGFIFLSGFKLLLTKSDNFHYGKFLLGRLLSIVIPYIIWVVIYYIYFCFHRNYFPFRIMDLLRYIFVGDLVGHFYFIIIIVQFYLLAPVWIWLVKRINGALFISFSLILTIIFYQTFIGFVYNDRVFTTYLVYWVAGCYAGLYYEKFKKILQNNRVFITVIFIVSAVLNVVFKYENIHILYCMSAILFFFMTAQYIKEIKFINKIDKVSYGIYLSHCLFIFIVDEFTAGLSTLSSYLIRIFTVYIVTIFSLLLTNKIKGMIKNGRRTRTRL